MSGWGDDYDAIGDEPPFGSEAEVAPTETDETVRARADLDNAVQAHTQTNTLMRDAEDALADAEGALRVATAKAADYEADEKKAPWQRLSAAEAVETARRARDRRAQTVEHRQVEAETAAAAVEDARRALDAVLKAAAASVDGGGDDEQPALKYSSVDEFVREYLRDVYVRRVDGRHRAWAARWWDYDEAVIRLEALWRAWEHLRQDPSTGMSVWWRDHADHHMAVLMDPDGPFAMATDGEENHSRRGQPLPYLPPPEGMF